VITQSGNQTPTKTTLRTALVIFAALCLTACIPAWSDNPATLREDLAGWMAHPALGDADVGVQVLSLPEGTVLYSLNGRNTFIPASTVKLVVTATALELLGADFAFHTLVWLQGPPDDTGLLAGDMTIGGTADPDAPGNLYTLLANKLKTAGIKRISGDIVGAAPVRASDKDNGLTGARALKMALRRAGIVVEGHAVAHPLPHDAFLIYRHKSTLLSSYVKTINKHSDNHRAQRLLTSLTTTFGDPDDHQHSFVDELWRQRGLYVDGLCVAEGSGLSADNRLTPTFVAGLLVQMTNQPDALRVLLNSLPIAGVDGTLHHRMRGTAAEGRVYAKTGTLHGVSCLSGYVLTDGEPTIAFSIMMNNYTCSVSKVRRIQDAAVIRIVQYVLTQQTDTSPEETSTSQQ